MKSRTKTLLVFLSFVCALAAHTFFSQASAQENPHRLERKLAAGSKVTLRLISGDIRITGWDGDTVQVFTDEDDNGRSVLAITEDASAGGIVISPAAHLGNKVFDLKINLPRQTELSLELRNGDISISNVTGAVSVKNGGGDVSISQVGPLTLAMGGGDMSVSKVSGNVTLKAGGGDLSIHEVNGAVSLSMGGGDISISQVGELDARIGGGDISVKEVKGSVTVNTTAGDMSLSAVHGNVTIQGGNGDLSLHDVDGNVKVTRSNGDVGLKNIAGSVDIQLISGDVGGAGLRGTVSITSVNGDVSLKDISSNVVEVTTTSGDVYVRTNIGANGRYRLKSTTGDVDMVIQPNPPGFNATLSSYAGSMETDFQLENSTSTNRNLRGKVGDGGTEINLDSFNGEVHLRKMGNEDKPAGKKTDRKKISQKKNDDHNDEPDGMDDDDADTDGEDDAEG